MKQILFYCLLFIGIFSCRKPQDSPSAASVFITKEWRIGYFLDVNSNVTANYSGWKFSFRADSTLQIEVGPTVYTGTWSENTNTKTFSFLINANTQQVNRLNKEWEINLINPTQVKLNDDKFNPRQDLRFQPF
jgi:hypothetical protein